jgi:DNA-binding GntR family transcriptional regulator
VDALLRNKPDAAADAMRRHIRAAATCALDAMRDNFTERPASVPRSKRRAVARV